jgi:mRNA degradation ribonuclease J1/J2
VNESSSSFKKGPFYSKYSIDENLKKILRNKKARTFVLTPYPLITRLAPILEEAQKLGKSVFSVGKDLADVISFGEEI